jgi:hypothetical protein
LYELHRDDDRPGRAVVEADVLLAQGDDLAVAHAGVVGQQDDRVQLEVRLRAAARNFSSSACL